MRYKRGWSALAEWHIPKDYQPLTKCSVLIPARNEAANILTCVDSILAQDYPQNLLEIIIIDDHSTDATPDLVRSLKRVNVHLLSLADFVDESTTKSFKKRAIETAMTKATGELILTTDADCLVPLEWLRYMTSFYQKNKPKFIAAPVNFYQEKNTLEQFQSLDFIGMMGITGAGIDGKFMNMCNGANLAYPKAVFEDIGGFEGIDHVASGDDMLLMQKIAASYPDDIGYMKNKAATILTTAKPDWSSFLRQRIRWASKSSSYTEWRVTFILAMVFFFCCNIGLSLLLIPFFGWLMLFLFIFQLTIKTLVDWFFLRQMSDYFDRKDLMSVFFPSQILHIVYIIVVGVLANFVKEYNWKGRRTR